ncbi:MAG TPA: hypothetical protein VFG45_13170 [Candidatus Nitrosocosmicus sp.]|nr:hypothetical protein [Candidatus Nitrosocosmicus sp.]
MSTDSSKDPLSYRKDLRKKMGQDQDSKDTSDQIESSTNTNNDKSLK